MLRNVSILGTARVLPAALAFLQSVVVARMLGPEAFGAVALIAAYPTLVFGILTVRTADTTTRFLAAYDVSQARSRALGLCKVAYSIDVCVAVLALVLVWITAPFIAPTFLSNRALLPLMGVFALSFLPNAFGPTSGSILIVANEFVLAAVLDTGAAVIRAALVIGLVIGGFGIPGVIYGSVVASAIAGLAKLVAAQQTAASRWGASWWGSGWAELAGHRREIARFYVLSDLASLFGVAIKTADVLVLAHFRPTVEIGYYNLGKSLSNQLVNLLGALRAVGLPQVVRLWTAGAWRDLWAYVRAHTVMFALPGVAGVGVLMVFVSPLITLVYGPAFAPAALVARLLLLQVALLLLTIWVDMVFTAWGDMHVLVLARGIGAVVTIGGIWLLVRPLGVVAGALALLAQQILAAVMTFAWMDPRRRPRALEAIARQDRLRASAAARVLN